MKNNTKTIKTVLFASLIAAMILPFSTMDFAEAQEVDKKSVEKLAKQYNKLSEQLETETDEKKKVNLKEKLDEILAELNSYGLYSDEQFEKIKDDRVDERPDEVTQSVAALSCPCPPEAWYRTGFDWEVFGLNGSTDGNWVTLKSVGASGLSEAETGFFGADSIDIWHQGFVRHATSANLTFENRIVNQNGGLVSYLGSHSHDLDVGGDVWYIQNGHYENLGAFWKVKTPAIVNSLS